jgi:hypothetical protein
MEQVAGSGNFLPNQLIEQSIKQNLKENCYFTKLVFTALLKYVIILGLSARPHVS